jgi:hypothetical protein
LVEAPFVFLALAACSSTASVTEPQGLVGGGAGTGGSGGDTASGGSSASDGSGGDMMMSMGGSGGSGAVGGGSVINPMDGMTDPKTECPMTTCKEQGIGCGKVVDKCGNVIDCADEGLTCGPLQVCTGGVDMPAQCQTGGTTPCEVCAAVKDCSKASQVTKLTGRVITPGRNDSNAANQLGVPNAFVYILRDDDPTELPAINTGIPAGGMACDRCQDQDFGPVLVSATTDATGSFSLEGNVPVGQEFVLVVKAGHFRRAIKYTIPAGSECTTVALPTKLPDNPVRLPRDMMDGLAVNIPRIAVTTGGIDAMECVLEKMGISHAEFSDPGDTGTATPRVHLYRGKSIRPNVADGASIDAATPLEDVLYGDQTRINSYDMVLADCEGQDADTGTSGTGMGMMGGGQTPFVERDAYGSNVVEYVNNGGRMFASHLRYSWLYGNGMQAYDPANAATTGLDAAATWDVTKNVVNISTGNGVIAVGRPQASPRIQTFADWMANEGVAMPPTYGFNIDQPRSQANMLGPTSEEFVLTTSVDNGGTTDTSDVTQQFSFNTPYGAPDAAVCGRVAYSGFHVVAETTGGGVGGTQPFENATFPDECMGDLSAQEKVLLYMLFDLNACVGMPPEPPPCTPSTCDSLMLKCGFSGDGCGNVLDCGPCPLPMEK